MNVMYTIELRQSILGFGKICALPCSEAHERSWKMNGIGPRYGGAVQSSTLNI